MDHVQSYIEDPLDSGESEIMKNPRMESPPKRSLKRKLEDEKEEDKDLDEESDKEDSDEESDEEDSDEETMDTFFRELSLKNPISLSKLDIWIVGPFPNSFDVPVGWPKDIFIRGVVQSDGTLTHNRSFSRPLMLMIFADFLETYPHKNPTLDFKLFALNYHKPIIERENEIKKFKSFENCIVSMFKDMQSVSMFPSSSVEVVRRCLPISVRTSFTHDESGELGGHIFLLNIEKHSGNRIRVKIFDNLRSTSYIHDTHRFLLSCVKDIISKYISSNLKDSPIKILRYNSICTANFLRIKKPTMTCVSATFRTCAYLSLIKDLYAFTEDDRRYRLFASFFQEQYIRMANWINTIYSSTGRMPAKSIEMNEEFFEVNRDNCYIALLNPKIAVPEVLLDSSPIHKSMEELEYFYMDAEYYKFNIGERKKSEKKNNAAIQFHRGSPGNGMCTVSRQFMTKM